MEERTITYQCEFGCCVSYSDGGGSVCSHRTTLQEIRQEIEGMRVPISSPDRRSERNAYYFNDGLYQALQVIDTHLNEGNVAGTSDR
jgi:hypothetical protein